MVAKCRAVLLILALLAAACGRNPVAPEPESMAQDEHLAPEPNGTPGRPHVSPTPTPGPDANLKRIMLTAADGVTLVTDRFTSFRDPDSIVSGFGGLKPRREYLQIVRHKNNAMVSVAYFEFADSHAAFDAAQNDIATHEWETHYDRAFACFNHVVKIASLDDRLAQQTADLITRKAGLPPVRIADDFGGPADGEDLSPAAPQVIAALDRVMADFAPPNGAELGACLKALAGSPGDGPGHPDRIEWQLAPDVKGRVSGRYAGMTLRAILDDMCRQTGCEWEIAGPAAIAITKRK